MQVRPEDKKKGGIYLITNQVNGKVYVGKSANIYRRIVQHLYDLREGRKKNENSYMLRAWTKYGESAFSYTVLEYLTGNDSFFSERELHWITWYDSVNRSKGYNLRRDSSTAMLVHEETRQKMAVNLKEQWKSGTRDGHSEKLTANWKSTPDRNAQQAEVMRKAITKYSYFLHLPEGGRSVTYAELKKLGLTGVITKYHKYSTADVVFKGIRIVRHSSHS